MIDLIHGPDERRAAEEASQALFGGKVAMLDEATLLEVVEEVPSSPVDAGDLAAGILLVDALSECGLVQSKSEARRAVEQGGVFVNDAAVGDLAATLSTADLLHGRYVVLRKGKRSYHLLVAR
jgi:tyrosyl-tRNA synthetase